MRNKTIIILILFIAFIVDSCNHTERQQEKQKIETAELKKSLDKANRYMVRTEEESINNYIERHGLQMINTGTGLRYQIIEQGSGPQVKKGNIVTIAYDLNDIQGNAIYSSKNDGNKTFIVSKGGVESGLEEAVLKLHQGDVAKIIIPSHLAFGLLGDQNKIASKTVLVYTIKIIEIQ